MNHYRFFYLIVYEYLKTLINMAKFELKFIDFKKGAKSISVKKETDFINDFIVIKIENKNSKEVISIDIDKSTAIKLSKTLRTEINKIKEVSNVI